MTLPSAGRITPYSGFDYSALQGNQADNYPSAMPHGLVNSGRLAKQVQWILSAAQLKALQTTAVQLVTAPGAGFVLVPTGMLLEFIFNTTTYTIGNADNAFQIEYTGKTTNLFKTNATGLVDQAASSFIKLFPAVAGQVLANTDAVNLGLEMKLVGTNPALTLGDGLLLVTLDYDVAIVY